MIKIIRNDENFVLKWNYAIKNLKSNKKDKVYYTQLALVPSELVEYWERPEYVYLYQISGRVYISVSEPQDFDSYPVKLLTKSDKQLAKDITLPKKFFTRLNGRVEGTVEYIFRLDEVNIEGTKGTVEIKLNIPDNEGGC